MPSATHQLRGRDVDLLCREGALSQLELSSELPWLEVGEGRGAWGRVGGRGAGAGTVLDRWWGRAVSYEPASLGQS